MSKTVFHQKLSTIKPGLSRIPHKIKISSGREIKFCLFLDCTRRTKGPKQPEKKTRIWSTICEGLRGADIEVTPEQVRCKFNRLQQKYKACVDNNRKSGRGHMTFEYFREMEEIFNVDKDIGEAETFGSKMVSLKRKCISDDTSLTLSQKITKRIAIDN